MADNMPSGGGNDLFNVIFKFGEQIGKWAEGVGNAVNAGLNGLTFSLGFNDSAAAGEPSDASRSQSIVPATSVPEVSGNGGMTSAPTPHELFIAATQNLQGFFNANPEAMNLAGAVFLGVQPVAVTETARALFASASEPEAHTAVAPLPTGNATQLAQSTSPSLPA